MNEEQITSPASAKVFNEIALSMSGGGYRAATFHLGTLSLLYSLDLLDSVHVLSTVSGGTIVGAAWAGSLVDKKRFPTFLEEFKEFLIATNVIDGSLKRLESSSTINGFKAMPSLIRAAAQVYADSKPLGIRTFGSLKVLPATDPAATQLQEISFNATDFRTGNSFRFQQSDSSAVYTGNKFARVRNSVKGKIRIADIVAASSCFPGGFEPIRFPSDFSWGGEKQLKEVKDLLGDNFTEDTALMDGGVFDNQGIDSISLIYNRKDNEIGVYIISDTSQRNAVYLQTRLQKKHGRLTVKQVSLLSWMLMAVAAVTVSAIAIDAYTTFYSTGISVWRGVFLYAVPFVLAAGVAFGLYKLRKLARLFLKEFDVETGIDVWNSFKDVTVPGAVELVMTRFKSVLAMTMSVFMKRIRDLGYKRIYGNSDFGDKRISNMIYDLDNESEWRDYVETAKIVPSDRLRRVAIDAETYGTNLWFTEQKDLDNLLACGEATMCFNILRYLLECRAEALKNPASPESDLYKRAHDYWVKIQ